MFSQLELERTTRAPQISDSRRPSTSRGRRGKPGVFVKKMYTFLHNPLSTWNTLVKNHMYVHLVSKRLHSMLVQRPWMFLNAFHCIQHTIWYQKSMFIDELLHMLSHILTHPFKFKFKFCETCSFSNRKVTRYLCNCNCPWVSMSECYNCPRYCSHYQIHEY